MIAVYVKMTVRKTLSGSCPKLPSSDDRCSGLPQRSTLPPKPVTPGEHRPREGAQDIDTYKRIGCRPQHRHAYVLEPHPLFFSDFDKCSYC